MTNCRYFFTLAKSGLRFLDHLSRLPDFPTPQTLTRKAPKSTEKHRKLGRLSILLKSFEVSMLLILWWGYARLSQLSQSHLHQVAFPAAWLACTAETASRDSDCIGANIKKWTFRRSVVIATYHFCWLLSTSLCMQLTMLLTGNLLWLKGKQEVDLLDLCNLCRLRHLQIPHTSTRTCKEAANPRLFCVLKKGFARLEKSWNLLPTARSIIER